MLILTPAVQDAKHPPPILVIVAGKVTPKVYVLFPAKHPLPTSVITDGRTTLFIKLQPEKALAGSSVTPS